MPEPTTSTAPHPNGNLEELQELLLAAERGRLDRLEDRLRNSVVEATAERKRLDQLQGDLTQLDDHIKNKVVDASAVANVLPDAIRQRTKQDPHLKESLAPIIIQTLMYAVRKFPQPVVDAISPVMGSAIRKYIEDALQGMVRTLDHSGLSWQGLTWRWEARKTGRSFAEVVLSHTVKYQVDRVVIFFKEDGVHLMDVHRSGLPPFEDLASGMFSAIQTAVQKFAQDEFQASEAASCKTFEMDDGTKVWIEQGPMAVLIAVVRGLPPPALRTKLQNALDSIHIELNEALQNFRGDKTPFEAARPHLESCLLREESDSRNKTGSTSGGWSPAFVVLLMLPVIWLIWWNVTSYAERQRWENFQNRVKETPGVHITSTTTNGKNGKIVVYGLRDPLSDEPQKIAQEVGLSEEVIDFQFEPYLSLAPKLIERRASQVLDAPESVRLTVPADTTVLNLTGTAPHAWIAQLRKASPTIPGITSIQDAELQDDDQQRLAELVRKVEAYHFDFEAGSASLSVEPGSALQTLLQELHKSDELAQQLGNQIRVEIHGNTSDEGSTEMNRRLALARAQGILSALNVEPFQAIDFLPVAGSVEPPVIGKTQDTKPLRARRVSFQVRVIDP